MSTLHGSGQTNLEGWDATPGPDLPIEQIIDLAFDYRGDVTVTTSEGTQLVGYLFNRDRNTPQPFVHLFDAARDGPVTLPYSAISRIKFTGKDTAAGNSYEAWKQQRSGEGLVSAPLHAASDRSQHLETGLLVIAPTARELGGLRDGRQGAIGTAVTGLGEAAALSLASRLAERRPSLVLSLGFAGALAPGLRTGALVLCDSFLASYDPLASHSESPVADEESGTRPFTEFTLERGEGFRVTPTSPPRLEADHPPLRIAAERLAQAGIGTNPGALLTVGAPLLTGAAKQQAGQETGAAVVDIEGYWLAQVARTYQVPFIALRVVLDPIDQTLPALVAAIVADQGRHEWRHAATALVNPLRIAQLISLASQSRRAQKALRGAAEVLVSALAGQTSTTIPIPGGSLHEPQKEGPSHDHRVE